MKDKKSSSNRPTKRKASAPAADVVVAFPTPTKPSRPEQPRRFERQTFKFRLRGGVTGLTVLRNEEVDRLWRGVQLIDDTQFVVFDSDERRMALNLRHLVASQFDLLGEDGIETEWVYEGDEVEIFFADSPKPLRLSLEPDFITVE